MMRRQLFLLGVLTVCLVACDVSITGVRGSGNLITEERDVSGFDQIDLRGSGRVIVQLGTSESLTIDADDNLMEFLTAEVVGTKLVLDTTRNVSPTEDITYMITAESLVGLQLSGSGEMETSDVMAGTFEFDLSGSGTITASGDFGTTDVRLGGSGDISVSGTSTHLEVRLNGSGSFDGEDLVAETGDVSLSGSGQAIVNATDSLTAEVSGSGEILYLGNPSLDARTPGSGSVRQR